MSSKAYLLLFDRHDKQILIGVKSATASYTPGGPCLFGGTQDHDASGKEKTQETLARELQEESTGRVRLNKGAKPVPFFSANGGKANFYWTTEFTANLLKFPANGEVQDVLGIDALHLLQNAASKRMFGKHLLFLVGSILPKTEKDFMSSYTLEALYHWVKNIFGKNQELQPDPTPTILPYQNWIDQIEVFGPPQEPRAIPSYAWWPGGNWLAEHLE